MMSRRNLASWRIRQRWGWCSRWRNTTQVSSRHLASALARQVDSSATLKKIFLDEILSQKIMPQNCIVVAREMTLCLTEIQAADGAHKIWRVWLHTDMLRGTCASRGRLIGFKSDSAELANGFMIFNKTSTPLECNPKLVLLHEVEGELGNNLTLYGHAITRGGSKVSKTPSPTPVVWLPNAPAIGGEGSGLGVEKFEAATLGQFLRSHEDTTGVPKCKGLARPVFEMKASPASQGAYTLMPGASPGRSALWLYKQ